LSFQPFDECRSNIFLDIDMRSSSTDLATIYEKAQRAAAEGGSDVGVVEDDCWLFATEFKNDLLEVAFAGLLLHFQAGPERASNADFGNLHVVIGRAAVEAPLGTIWTTPGRKPASANS
jgi:hypothetical protein